MIGTKSRVLRTLTVTCIALFGLVLSVWSGFQYGSNRGSSLAHQDLFEVYAGSVSMNIQILQDLHDGEFERAIWALENIVFSSVDGMPHVAELAQFQDSDTKTRATLLEVGGYLKVNLRHKNSFELAYIGFQPTLDLLLSEGIISSVEHSALASSRQPQRQGGKRR
jgi:hypothetical protein